MMNYHSIFERVREASRHLYKIDVDTIDKVLRALADEVEKQASYILAENLMDLANPKYDRLKLTKERIKRVANDIRNVSNFPYPVGKVLERRELVSGLQLSKVAVPNILHSGGKV